MPKITHDELQTLLAQAEASFPHGACSSCECFLGYLAQLRVDLDPVAKPYPSASQTPAPNPQEDATQSDVYLRIGGWLGRGKLNRKNMHKCLGCEPCPPGDLYAKYMKKKHKSDLITI